MNEPTHTPAAHDLAALEVHRPVPLVPSPAPLAPVQLVGVPAVARVVLPDGRVVTGYTVAAAQPEPVTAKPAISRAAVNVALGGVGFLAVCGGLSLLTAFISALTALITQLVILAAVIFGGWIAAQVFGTSGHRSGTTVHIRKAVIKRSHFHS